MYLAIFLFWDCFYFKWGFEPLNPPLRPPPAEGADMNRASRVALVNVVIEPSCGTSLSFALRVTATYHWNTFTRKLKTYLFRQCQWRTASSVTGVFCDFGAILNVAVTSAYIRSWGAHFRRRPHFELLSPNSIASVLPKTCLKPSFEQVCDKSQTGRRQKSLKPGFWRGFRATWLFSARNLSKILSQTCLQRDR